MFPAASTTGSGEQVPAIRVRCVGVSRAVDGGQPVERTPTRGGLVAEIEGPPSRPYARLASTPLCDSLTIWAPLRRKASELVARLDDEARTITWEIQSIALMIG